MSTLKSICAVAAFVIFVSSAFALPTVEVSNTSSNGTVFGACEVCATVTASAPSQVAWTSRGVSHVFFDDAAALKTEAYFPVTGTYTLVCTVTDPTGSSSAEMTVNVVQVGSKPIPDIAHYTLKTKTKCYYGTGSGGKNAYLYYPDYFGSKSFEECPFYEGTAGCTYAISSPTVNYQWSMAQWNFTKIGQPDALTVGFWINGEAQTISRVSSGKGSQHWGFSSADVNFCSDSSKATGYGGRMTDIRLYGWELGEKQDPDIFLYKLKSANLMCQYDARDRTYTWPNNNPISTDGYFSGTYGFSCPTVSTSVQPVNMPTIANPTALVFTAWIKMDDMTNTNGRLIGILNAFYAGVNKSGSGDGKYRLYVGLGNGMSESWTWTSDYVLPTSGWHHFAAAVVLDENGKGQGKLWLDASPVAIVSSPASSVVIPTISKNSYSHLGNRYNTVVAGSMAFSGVMSDIRFYAHELGDLDIRKLQNEKDFENRAPEIYKTADWPAKMAKKTWYPLPLEAYDDGLPADGEFSATWAVTGGDAANVVFDDEKDVKFLRGGEYELTYTVTDGQYTLVRRASTMKI